ncbi:hypothetical protein TREMEDRAFT_58156 [Tremella mesenterica DSM 1558]|uniref:uncharacterized protein n=1 Tax=Tremella mesenterica (strain ATCC 24925 / CBS 8224 / DSM 1558 / NBRC 9311 / NRRL Y-6157 / RJB 2259-6 / UBC 559-6) TaxID=578456 RepID=UPI0003F49DFB|nr:uncharacterized protein TREMEDRAFT_58156 [Tremella mesenterica DSM 1558]EIW72014.1 hypothetical protein TREMEDRAFT_58156 [Tremella mesenterica DSM 1558]
MNVGSASDPIDLTRDEYDISPIKVFDSTRMPSNRSLEPTDVPSTSIPSLTIDGPVVVQPVRTQTIHDPLQLAYIPPSHMYTKSDGPSDHPYRSYDLALDQKLILPQQRKREVFPWNFSMSNRFEIRNGKTILKAEMARLHVTGEPPSAQSDIDSTVTSVVDMTLPPSVSGEMVINPTHNPEGSVERQYGLNAVSSSVRYSREVRISRGITRWKSEQAKEALHHPYARRGTDEDVRSSRKTITRENLGDPTMHLTQKENCQDSFAPLSQNKSTPQVIHQNRPMTPITTSQTQCSPFQQATDNLLEPLEEPPSGSTPKSPRTSGPSKNIGDAIMTMSCDTSKEVTTELPANDPTIVLSHVATPSTNLTRNAASLSNPIDPPNLYPELENLLNNLPFEMRPTTRMSTIFSSFRRHPESRTKSLNSPLFYYTFHPKISVEGQICDTGPARSARRDQRSNWINQVYLAYVVRQTMEVVDIVGEKKISQEGLKKCTYVEKEKYGLGHLFTPEEGMKSLDDALRSWTAGQLRGFVSDHFPVKFRLSTNGALVSEAPYDLRRGEEKREKTSTRISEASGIIDMKGCGGENGQPV